MGREEREQRVQRREISGRRREGKGRVEEREREEKRAEGLSLRREKGGGSRVHS